MNELWGTWTGLWIYLYGSRLLTAHSQKGRTQLKIRPQDYIWLALEVVAVWASHNISMEVNDNSVLIVGDPQVILSEQLGDSPIYLTNVITTLIKFK